MVPTLRIADDEMIIDLFAGGGGWSVAIEQALGRSPDVAVNHDSDAVAMHEANHPRTKHFIEDVRDVDPTIVCRGCRVGLLVLSPDCTHHSRARNGMIKRDKEIRCLSNVAHRWCSTVRPRVFVLECVRELESWGPLDDNGLPDKSRTGESFEEWWVRLEHMGYRLSKRILKACDFDTPTSRERLFVIGTCDPDINPDDVWPEATNGPGRPLPYRTAAECIDYSLPCPSIFLSKREARELTRATGIRCKRPLAEKTMLRIRRGLFKYVINCARPFLIPVTHGGVDRDDRRVYDSDEPMRTVTGASRGEFGFVAPVMTAYHGESEGGGNERSHTVTAPLPTQDTANRFGMIAPTLVQTGYGERKGQAPRCLDLEAPLGTNMAGGCKYGLVASFLEKGYSERPTGGWNGGQPLTDPTGAITCRDHHHLVTGHMVKFRGTSEAHMDSSSSSYEDTVPTISANGNHVAEVRAFLTKYYGTGESKPLTDPLDTVTTKDRFGLVTVEGVEYQIVDIGFRMLKPRELFRAQGFPPDFIIDPIVPKRDKHGNVRLNRKTGKPIMAPLCETAQVEKVGNSVPPPLGAAILRSIFAVREVRAAA